MTGQHTKPINILQLNTNRSNSVCHAILNATVKSFDILLLTEPWFGFIGNDQRGPVALSGWYPILPLQPIPEDLTPRTMAYYRRRDDFHVTLRSDLVSDADIQILQVDQPPNPPTLIVNVYNQQAGDDRNSWSVDRLRNVILPENLPVIITGDFNMHHPLWAVDEPRPDPRAEALVEWLVNKRMTMCNDKGKPTFLSHCGRATSVLDLTFANNVALETNSILEWRVAPELAHGSDHYALTWRIDRGAVALDNVTAQRFRWRNLEDDTPKKWKTTYKSEAEDRAWAFRGLYDERPSVQTLDIAALELHNAIQAAMEAHIPKRKDSIRARPWWTPELTQAYEFLRDLRRSAQIYLSAADEEHTETQDMIRRTKNRLKRLTKAAKRKWIEDELGKATPDDIWAFTRWPKGIRQYPSPPINPGQGLPAAVSHEVKCNALRNALFQPPPPIHAEPTDLEQEHPDDIPWKPVSHAEIRRAIHAPNQHKAPGPSQINYMALRWAWAADPLPIYLLISQCASVGYHPQIWRKTVAVALRKPKKPDYSNPRAYRLIQLEECLGKVLESVIARRLSHMIHTHNLVPATQFGSRPGSSTVDAALTFTHDIEAARNHSLVTTSLTLDIKGFFDYVNHDKLTTIMCRKRIPLPMVKWVNSFLSNREAAICLDGRTSDSRPVENGIPQGSPISPALSILYASPVYEEFQSRLATRYVHRAPPSAKLTPTSLVGYIDDVNTYVSSTSLQENVTALRADFITIQRILAGLGFLINFTKCELTHFTRQHNATFPDISLPGPDGDIIVSHRGTMKWLGITFDSKLLFNDHVKAATNKVENIAKGLTMLGNTVRGLHQSLLRTIYGACVRSVMTYASPVWWVGKKKHAHKLTRVQNACLRHICAAFCTTPIHALEIDSATPPIPLVLDRLSSNAASRLHKLARTSPIYLRLPQEWQGYNAPYPAPPLPPDKFHPRSRKPPKTTCLTKLASRSSPAIPHIDIFAISPWSHTISTFSPRLSIRSTNNEDDKKKAADAHNEYVRTFQSDPLHVRAYSDGSLRKDDTGQQSAGAGWVGYHNTHEIFHGSKPLGPHMEIYDAEATAINSALSTTIVYALEHNITHIHVFADNQAAVQTAFDVVPGSSQHTNLHTRSLIISFLESSNQHYIEIAWALGHKNIVGNERADTLAKAATEIAIDTPPISLSHEKAQSRQHLITAWTTEWRKQLQRPSSFLQANRFAPALKPHEHFTHTRRNIYGRLIQCRTGHAFMGEYYNKHVPTEDRSCPCGELLQSRDHILATCPMYADQRQVLKTASEDLVTSDILGTKEGIEALIQFLRATNAFKKHRPPTPPEVPPAQP